MAARPPRRRSLRRPREAPEVRLGAVLAGVSCLCVGGAGRGPEPGARIGAGAPNPEPKTRSAERGAERSAQPVQQALGLDAPNRSVLSALPTVNPNPLLARRVFCPVEHHRHEAGGVQTSSWGVRGSYPWIFSPPSAPSTPRGPVSPEARRPGDEKMATATTAIVQAGTRGSLTFEDVAVTFSPEEWMKLGHTEQHLYWDVTLGNYQNLLSLDRPPERTI
ncbi:uncharacterized protein LOC119948790 [Tachyglossus aculeatus]|uniref:uncharacterized protein LOC119948790 n=1 Tax=Tachyglossus aculeatus TaxID=9261 RepID=UPI0018F59765|nr:uncharacterized protein LOC119948790 [Tachyglossus aculeatus]